MATHTLSLQDFRDPATLDSGSILFVGTATTIIRCGGFTILTDPNFLHAGDHAHLGYGLTSERLTNPAIEIETLPPLDLCLLSHLHGDHWDSVAEAKLPRTLPIITTPHAAKALVRRGFIHSQGLKPWQDFKVVRGSVWVNIISMPGRHGPGVVNTFLPPVMGSMLEWGRRNGKSAFRLYISGDTLAVDQLREIPQRYPDINLALLHLGGTRIFGILVTMDAKQGIQAIRLINPHKAIPIHYNDYPVFKSSLEEFMQAVTEAGLDDKVHYLHHGDTYTFDVT